MSTTGKILTVLVALAALAFVYLASSVLEARRQRNDWVKAKLAEVHKVQLQVNDLKFGAKEARQKYQDLMAAYEKALNEFIQSDALANFNRALQRLIELAGQQIVEEAEWQRAREEFRKASEELTLARQKLDETWNNFLGVGREPGIRELPNLGLGIPDLRRLIRLVDQATIAQATYYQQRIQRGDENLTSLDDLVKEAEDEAQTQRKVAEQANAVLAHRQEEVQEAKRELAEAKQQLDQTLAELNKTQQYVSKLDQRVKALQSENLRLVQQLKEYEIRYDVFHNVKSAVIMPDGRIPRGRIAEVDEKNGTLLIDLGKRQGMRPGLQLHVYRYQPEPEYLGVLEIVSADTTTAVARMLPAYSQMDVRVGDIVAPEISP